MAFPFLMNGHHTSCGALREKLTTSGLSSALKADKRAELAQKLEEIADVRVETKLKIGRTAVPPRSSASTKAE